MKKYLTRPIQFAYPDKNGLVKIETINLIVEEKDRDTFDKFYNYIHSLFIATGNKAFPIHDYSK